MLHSVTNTTNKILENDTKNRFKRETVQFVNTGALIEISDGIVSGTIPSH